VHYDLGSGLGGTDATGVVPDNQWSHIALTVTGSSPPTVKVFINGQETYSATYPRTRGTLSGNFNLGSNENSSAAWGGQLDQVKIWNSALTQADVLSSMHAYSRGGLSAPTLLAHYDFNEFSAGAEVDRSGNGRNLTANASITQARYLQNLIITTSSAFTNQTVVQFNRSYLTAAGGWQAPAGVSKYRALVVAGGGGGGGNYDGGGGGAGGVVNFGVFGNSSSAPISIVVGQGGHGGLNTSVDTNRGSNGQNSILGAGTIAIGGGGGGGYGWTGSTTEIQERSRGRVGGSGGGHGESNLAISATAGLQATDSTTYSGGVEFGNSGGSMNLRASQAGSGGGGAGGAGVAVTTFQVGGQGGAGISLNISGTSLFYAAGGGGADRDGPGAFGGSGIGGQGGGTNADTPGAVNTGSGGGGANFSEGSTGGSGVVILSYGPTLEVTQSPSVAPAGQAFSNPIRIQLTNVDGSLNTSTAPVSVTASAGVLTRNGVALTQSFTVNAVNGIAEFSGLGFASNVAATQTLTFTSDSFVSATLLLTPSFMPENVNITNAGVSGGSFVEGLFYATSGTGTVNINNSDLVSHMASFSTLISTSGSITVTNGFTSASSSHIVLKAGSFIHVSASQQIRTAGGDIVLWADSDNTGGGVIRLLNAATLCTVATTCSTSITGGGNIVLGGGLPDPNNPLRPGGTAKGSGTTYNTSGSGDTTGVQLGTLGQANQGAKLYSAGGNITIRGQLSPSRTANGYNTVDYGINFQSGTEINSGVGKIFAVGETVNAATGDIGTIYLDGAMSIQSSNTSSDSIVFEGREVAGALSEKGLWGRYEGISISSPGGIIIRADLMESRLNLDLNISGSFVVEPFSNVLQNSIRNTSTFIANFGTGNAINFIVPPAAIRIGSDSNSSRVDLESSLTASGNIEVIANRIEVLATTLITTTSLSAKILLKTRDFILIKDGTSVTARPKLQTNNGDLVLWSDSDGDGTGAIQVGNFTDLNTANGAESTSPATLGGKIILAGGASVDSNGYPSGNSGPGLYLGRAVWLRDSSDIFSGGGDIRIRGKSNSAAGVAIGGGVDIFSGNGAIEVYGETTNGAVVNRGVEFLDASGFNGPVNVVSHSTQSPAILVTGISAGTQEGLRLYGEQNQQVLTIASAATSGGGVSLNASSPSASDSIFFQRLRLLSANGEIIVNGGPKLTSFDYSISDEVLIGSNPGGPFVTSSSANVTFTSGSFDFDRASTTYNTSGIVSFLPFTGNSFAANLDFRHVVTNTGGLVIGQPGNTFGVTLNGVVSISGDVSVFASRATVSSSVTTTGLNRKIEFRADAFTTSAVISATNSGTIVLAPNTAGRQISLGAVSGSALAIPASPTLLRATTLQIGNSQSGTITLAASMNFSTNIANLKLVTQGSVTGVAGAILTAQNLAIDAGGPVNLPGNNSVSANVAISASSIVTYSSAVSYSVAVVSGVTPVFGVGAAISQINSPTVQEANEFLAVTFNPPPQVAIRDAYNNVLAANNRLAASYTVSASVASGSGTVTGASTLTRVGGNITFSDLKITNNTGVHAFTFSAQIGPTNFLTARSVDYNVQGGDPASLTVVATDFTAPAGQTGFDFKVDVKDVAGNLINSGASANITVSASVSGVSSALVSGGKIRTDDSGRATFTDLVITGSVSSAISISFFVEFVPIGGNLTTVSSAVFAINLTPGTPDRLILSPNSLSVQNRSSFSPIAVAMTDAFGNVVLTRTDQITAAITSGSGASLTGTTTTSLNGAITAESRATFSNLALVGTVGSFIIQFSSAGVAPANLAVTLTHAQATQLVFITQSAQAKSDIDFIQQPVLELRDANNNRVSSSAAVNIIASSLGSSWSPSLKTGADLTGTKTRATVNGIVSFTDLRLSGQALDYQINYLVSGTSISVSETISLGFGSATKLTIDSATQTSINRSSLSAMAISVEDAWGNKVSGRNDSISAAITTNPGGVLVGSSTSGVAQGSNQATATFSNLAIQGVVGQYVLVFSSNQAGIATVSHAVTLTHAAANSLTLVTNPAGARAGLAFDTQPVLELRDLDGNRVSTSAEAVLAVTASYSGLALSADGADLGGVQTVTMVAGIATFSDLKLSGKAASYNLDYSIGSSIFSTSGVVALAAGNPNKVYVIQQPSNIVAGEQFASSVSGEILDAFNNRVLTLGPSATLRAIIVNAADNSDANTSSAEVGAQSGVVTFATLTHQKVGNFKIKLVAGASSTATGLTPGFSNQFSITHNVANKLAWVSVEPTASSNDAAITPLPEFQVLDAFDNPVSTGPVVSVSATVVSGSGSLSGSVSATAGNQFVRFDGLSIRGLAGNYKLRFTGSIAGNVFGFVETTGTIALGSGLPRSIAITTPAQGARAGLAFDQAPVIEIRDSAGNRVLQSSLTVAISATSQNLIGVTAISASNGLASFGSDLGLSGTATNGISLSYAISYAGVTYTASQAIDLLAGNPNSIKILQDASNIQTRFNFSPAPSVEILDSFNNRVLADSTSGITAALFRNGNEVLSKSSPVTAASGVATFGGLSFIIAPQSGYYLEFELASISASVTSSNFVIQPGPIARVEIIIEPSTTIGSELSRTGNAIAMQPRVKLVDQDGFLVTTQNSGSVTAAIASGVGGTLISASAVVSSGVAQFADLGLVGQVAAFSGDTPESYQLRFGFGSVNSSNSAAISVKHNVPAKVIQVVQASGGQSGQGFATGPSVKILDNYDNLVFSEATAPTIRIDGFIGSSATSVVVSQNTRQSVGGFATFSPSIAGLVSNTYRFEFVVDSDLSVTKAIQSGISLTPGVASRVVLVTEPLTSMSGVVSKTGAIFQQLPTVEIQDSVGNVVTSTNRELAVTISAVLDRDPNRAATKDRLIGFTASAIAGVATFSNLALIGDPAATYTLQFYDPNNNLVRSNSAQDLRVTHADPEYVSILQQPVGGNKTGSSLSTSPIVEARDFDGNLVTSLNQVTISAIVSSGGGALASGFEASVVSGVANFQNLILVALPGVAQTLKFELVGALNSASATVTSTDSAAISVTFTDADRLRVSQQPSATGITAEVLAMQPIVEVLDRFNNLVTDYVGQVSVSVIGGRLVDGSDNTISSLSALVASGSASFTGLRIEGPVAGSFSFQFESTGLTSTQSSAISLTPDVVHSLQVSQQPVGGITGQVLTTQPIIRVVDRFGNTVVSDDSSQLTVSVSGDLRPGGLSAVVSGSTTVRAVSGVATFAGLELTGRAGSDYILGFSDGIRSVSANSTRVSVANAQTIRILQEPIAVRTGDQVSTPAIVQLYDFDGNIALSTSATIAVSVTGGGGYIEAGTTSSVVTSSGDAKANFGALKIVGTPGVPQFLTYTATDDASGQSFSVTSVVGITLAATDAAAMTISNAANQSIRQGELLATQPILRLLDRYGNNAVNDSSSVITASIGTGAGGAVSGSATATALNGVATFTGLGVTGSPVVDYTLNFSAAAGYSVVGTGIIDLYKTADINVSYSSMVFSASPTVSPAVAVTDSNEHALFFISSTTQFCTVDSATGVATIVGAGTCVIGVSVDDGNDYKANSKTVNLVITKANQAAIFVSTSATASSGSFEVEYGQSLPLGFSGGTTNLPVRYLVDGFGFNSSDPSAIATCSRVGGTLLFGETSNLSDLNDRCFVEVEMMGNANYNSVRSGTYELVIVKTGQAGLSIANSLEPKVGDITLFTTGGSGTGSVSYSVVSAGSAVCSITGAVLSASSNGTCEVSATKAASKNHDLRVSPAVTFTFSKQVQQVSFTSMVPLQPLPGQSYNSAATASSGLAISYAVTRGAGTAPSFSDSVCVMSQTTSGQVLFTRSGFCEITATQTGSSAFASATAKQLIEVGTKNQTITFPEVTTKVFGIPSFTLGATATSNLAVSYSVSGTAGICSISSNGLVTLLAAGNCQITASQAGNGEFAPAPNVSRIFTVTPDQAGAPALVSAAVGNQWYTVGYTEPSYLGGSTIKGYRLEVTDVNGLRYVNSACPIVSPLTCTMTGIPNNVSYTARVAAITEAGTGRFSNATLSLTPSRAEMSVTQLSANVQSGTLDLGWVTPVALEGNFQRYEIYVWVTGTNEPSTPSTVLTNSGSAAVAVAIADISNVPSDPSLSPRVNFQAPSLTIIRPLFQPTGGVYIFGAQAQGRMGFFSLTSLSTPSTESAQVGYTMKVATITDAFSSSQTINTANGVKIGLGAPEAPTSLTLDTSDVSKIVVKWSAPASDGGFAVLDYDLSSNGQVICANIQLMVCEISPLTAGTTYNIEVKARNAIGLGAPAQAIHTTAPAPIVLSTDTGGSAGGPAGGSTGDSAGGGTTPNPQPTPSPTSTPRPTPTVKPTPSPTAITPAPAPSGSGESGSVTPGTQGENFGSGSSESSSSAPAVTTEPRPTDPENPVTNPPIAGPNEQGESQTQAFNSSLVIAGLLGLAALLAILLAALRRRKQAENNL
jgi:hypothetical protein